MRINRVARTYRIPVKTDREIKRLAKINSTPGKKCSEADVIAMAIKIPPNGLTLDKMKFVARLMDGVEDLSPRVIVRGKKSVMQSARPEKVSPIRRHALARAKEEDRSIDFIDPGAGFRRAHPNGTVEVL